MKTNPLKLRTANKEEMLITDEANLRMSIPNIPSTIFKVNALVAKELAFEIILGTEFLGENEVQIDFKNNYITIDGFNVDEFGDENQLAIADEILIQNSCIVSVSEDEARLQELISSWKTANNSLKIINESKHYLKLKSKSPIFCKPYKIPEAFENQMKNARAIKKKHEITKFLKKKNFDQ